MIPLSEKHKLILLEGARICGNYKANDVLGPFGEQLSTGEFIQLSGFLEWANEKKKKFGHGNIEQVWEEYQEDSGFFQLADALMTTPTLPASKPEAIELESIHSYWDRLDNASTAGLPKANAIPLLEARDAAVGAAIGAKLGTVFAGIVNAAVDEIYDHEYVNDEYPPGQNPTKVAYHKIFEKHLKKAGLL